MAVTLNKRKLKKLQKVLGKTIVARVGIANADNLHPNSDSVTIGDIAKFHEFGTVTIPERSFIRSTFHKHSNKYLKEIRRSAKVVIKKRRKFEFDSIAKVVVADVRATIDAGIPPPLADGSGRTPLRDTDTLRNSISYEIKDKE